MKTQDAIRAAFESAADLIKGSALPYEAFREYVQARSVSPERTAERAPDLYIAAACASGDRAALSHFDIAVIGASRGALRRYGDSDFVAEVLQRLRVHLLVADRGEHRVARYDGRASLRSWVGVCAVRMALYTLRGEKNRREMSVDWSEGLLEISTGDPVLDELKATYATAFGEALAVASRELSARHRSVMKLRFAHGVSVDDIATTYAVHRVTAWRWLQGAQEALLERALEHLRLAIPNDEVGLRSLIALVKSRIELSMLGLFEDDVEP